MLRRLNYCRQLRHLFAKLLMCRHPNRQFRWYTILHHHRQRNKQPSQ
jgi:hypothetical protein